MLKLNKHFRDEEIFDNLYFLTVQIWEVERKRFFSRFFVDILTLGSGSVDPHIFYCDPEMHDFDSMQYL